MIPSVLPLQTPTLPSSESVPRTPSSNSTAEFAPALDQAQRTLAIVADHVPSAEGALPDVTVNHAGASPTPPVADLWPADARRPTKELPDPNHVLGSSAEGVTAPDVESEPEIERGDEPAPLRPPFERHPAPTTAELVVAGAAQQSSPNPALVNQQPTPPPVIEVANLDLARSTTGAPEGTEVHVATSGSVPLPTPNLGNHADTSASSNTKVPASRSFEVLTEVEPGRTALPPDDTTGSRAKREHIEQERSDAARPPSAPAKPIGALEVAHVSPEGSAGPPQVDSGARTTGESHNPITSASAPIDPSTSPLAVVPSQANQASRSAPDITLPPVDPSVTSGTSVTSGISVTSDTSVPSVTSPPTSDREEAIDGPAFGDRQTNVGASDDQQTHVRGAIERILVTPDTRTYRTIAVTDRAEPLPATTPPLPDELAEQMWNQVERALHRVRATADGHELRLRLRPAELGDLMIRVQTTDSGVTVQVVASNPAAQRTLEFDSGRLRSELSNAGFGNSSVDVSHRDQGDHGGSSAQPNSGGHGRGEPRRDASETPYRPVVVGEFKRIRPGGSVDLTL